MELPFWGEVFFILLTMALGCLRVNPENCPHQINPPINGCGNNIIKFPVYGKKCSTMRSYGKLSGTTIAVSWPRVFYFYMKTIERAHMPNKLWERVKLPKNYEKALEIIDKHLMYWPKLLVHKTKQRLTKMTQMQIRMRKLALKTREKIMTMPTKQKKREARREEKAEKAAVLEKSIEKELLERLKKGVYGDIYNYPVDKYNEILDKEVGKEAVIEYEEEEEPEIEYVEGYEELEEEEDMEEFGGLAIRRDYDNVEMHDDDRDEDGEENASIACKRGIEGSARKLEREEAATKSKKKVKVHVEVEHEDAIERQTAVH